MRAVALTKFDQLWSALPTAKNACVAKRNTVSLRNFLCKSKKKEAFYIRRADINGRRAIRYKHCRRIETTIMFSNRESFNARRVFSGLVNRAFKDSLLGSIFCSMHNRSRQEIMLNKEMSVIWNRDLDLADLSDERFLRFVQVSNNTSVTHLICSNFCHYTQKALLNTLPWSYCLCLIETGHTVLIIVTFSHAMKGGF